MAEVQRIKILMQACLSESRDKESILDQIETCDGSNIRDVTAIKGYLISNRTAFLTRKEQLLELIDPEEIQNEMKETGSIEIELDKTIQLAESLIGTKIHDTRSERASFNNSIKLPSINLPFFDGKLLDFMPFFEAFSSIHDNPEISATNKFNYLMGQLRGTPKQMLQGFSRTASAYNHAIELLKNKYADQGRTTDAFYEVLLRIQGPTTTLASLQEFQNQFETTIRQIQAIGVQIDVEFGCFLTRTVELKLPEAIRDSLTRRSDGKRWNLDTFRAQLREEINHRERIQTNKNENTGAGKPAKPSNSSRSGPQTGVYSASNIYVVKCPLCEGAHGMFYCQTYNNLEKRKARVSELKLCFRCIRPGHPSASCTSIKKCRTCEGNHHGLLCYKTTTTQPWKSRQNNTTNATQPQKAKQGTAPATSASALTVSTNSVVQRNTPVALPIAKMTIRTANEPLVIRAMFDQGAQRTFILRDIVNQARLISHRNEYLTIDGFNSRQNRELYPIVNIEVMMRSETVLVEAVVVNHLPDRIQMPGLQEVAQRIAAAGLTLAEEYDEDVPIAIDVLIGADSYYKFVEAPTHEGVTIIQSKLGIMFTGPYPSNDNHGTDSVQTEVTTVLKVGANAEPGDIDFLWKLELMGINPKEAHPDEDLALANFESSIRYEDKRYVARLPWKATHAKLPSNYGLAKGRLENNLKRLHSNPVRLQQYQSIMQEQLDNDFIEEVNESKRPDGHTVHYLAHHGVHKESLTTPLRVVFDCSARSSRGTPSLNDCLYSGPSLIPELTKVLMRFRLEPYAITADIRKAFLMIGLDMRDRDATRFLWPENPSDPTSAIKTYRFKVILFGATCSQFILNATIQHHLQQFRLSDQIISNRLSRNLYVDNVFDSANNASCIQAFYEGARKMLDSAGLQLRAWATNATAVANNIRDQDDLDPREEVPILGLRWNTSNDQLSLTQHFVNVNQPTKRLVLRGLASQFDPLGLFAPITLHAKILMQDIWKEKFDWDDNLPIDLVKRWEDTARDLNELHNASIPRAELIAGNATLHAFADASTKAYGAVLYGVQNDRASLLIAKTRVAPLKELTITKLELTAVTLATRLVCYALDAFKNELKFEDIHIWSDSQVALGWIKSHQPLPAYMQNRVDEIRTRVPNAKWHYVPSKENPADIVSRGAKLAKLHTNELWWHGPTWLCHELPPEVPEQEPNGATAILALPVPPPKEPSVLNTIIHKYSTLTRATRVAAQVIRCVRRFKRTNAPHCLRRFKQTDGMSATEFMAPLTADELQFAERELIISVQKEAFTEVRAHLQTSSNSKRPELLNSLNIQIRDRILVCVTRLSTADVAESAKYPILLPAKHPFTTLLIRDAHVRQLHMGLSATVAYLRENYWILRSRQSVKSIISKCVICRRMHGTPYPTPPVPSLPHVRTQEGRPFATTGVDYGGPITITHYGRPAKRYIALFTCAVTRAIHLEVAEDLSAITFLHVFQRFVARRSYPSVLISDNGTNFTSASDTLQQWERHPTIQATLADRHCKWQFIPSRAPWFGGFYERLIKMTKLSLNKILGNNRVSDQEFSTLMCRIEAQLNDRPLTYVSDQLDDATALTPSMLTHGFRLDSIPLPMVEPDEIDDPTEIDRDVLHRRLRYSQMIFQRFWTRWQKEYLLMLRTTGQKKTPNKFPIVGDIVIIHDEASRLLWQLGRVVAIIPGTDNHIRIARVRTSHSVLTRPITKLYPLEVNSNLVHPGERGTTPSTQVTADPASEEDITPISFSGDEDSADATPSTKVNSDPASEEDITPISFSGDEDPADGTDNSIAPARVRQPPVRAAARIARQRFQDQF